MACQAAMSYKAILPTTLNDGSLKRNSSRPSGARNYYRTSVLIFRYIRWSSEWRWNELMLRHFSEIAIEGQIVMQRHRRHLIGTCRETPPEAGHGDVPTSYSVSYDSEALMRAWWYCGILDVCRASRVTTIIIDLFLQEASRRKPWKRSICRDFEKPLEASAKLFTVAFNIMRLWIKVIR